MRRPAALSWLAASLGFAFAAVAAAQAVPTERCPDVRGVDFKALAQPCAPDVTVAGGARLSRAACDTCAAALFGALAPLFTAQGMPMPGACLPTLLPPLAAAGADVAALSQCAGVLGSGGGPGSVGIAAGVAAAPVRYSPECAALPLAASFSPAWLSRATATCLSGGACDAACLRRVRDFLRAFARAGCVDEYFATQRDRAKQPGAASSRSMPGPAANADAAAAARLALEERAVAALLPVVAAGADDLACTRNAAGDFCLSFTDALPASSPASPASLGAALLAPAAAPAASGAAAMGGDPATRCAAWANMGCCAPLVASLGLRAASALTSAMGFADAVAPAPAGAPPPGAAADAAAARAMLAQLSAQCSRALGGAAPNISQTPCGAADAYLNAAQYDKPSTVRWYRDRNGRKQLSGIAIAALVFFVLFVALSCACCAYCMGRRAAKKDRHVQLQEFARNG